MKYLFSVLLFAYSYSLQGQFVAYDFISSFGMKIGIHADGTMFMDEFKSNGCYFVDTEDLGHNTIFSSSLWFSGNQLNGNSVATASTYGGQGSGESFTPGIISQNSFDFNKVWKVSGASIKQLKADYADNENIDGPISNGILAWPGKGNVELPDLPDQDFAPFYDQNGDGIYEPLGGDYPIIGDDLEDIVPHEMIYIVYHDDFTFNGVKLEVHSQFYTLECDNIDVTQSSLFSRHRINKKQNSIENFKFGIWSDFDIGCITDDVLGSIPEMNAHYGYNVDPIDGNIDGECAFGVNSFGDNPGVQSITFLNQNMDAFNAYVGIFMSVPPSMYEPVTPIEYNRVMEGFWRDGTPITIGDNKIYLSWRS